MARWSGRRRKPRVVWLPNTGTQMGTGRATNPYDNASSIEVATTFTGDTGEVVSSPLVLDQQPEEQFIGSSLAVLDGTGLNQNISYGYRLRRIVGKFFASVTFANDQIRTWPAIWLKLGIMVRRVTEAGISPLNVGDVDPIRLANVPDPWIWQRNFILGIPGTGIVGPSGVGAAPQRALQAFSSTTDDVGGSKDGPTLDIKTARRIGPEERLFLDMSVEGLPLSVDGGNVDADNIFLYTNFDYRVLASIITNSGNRRNASR